MSIVTSERSAGAPSRKCDVIPEPWPITAAVRAPGWCASAITGSSVCVTWSPSSGRRDVSFGAGRIQPRSSEASGLPFVDSV
jgi:hypothetical protein